MKPDTPRIARWLLFHLVSLAVVLVFLMPLAWMLSASLRQPGTPPPRVIEWLPQPVAWSNYASIFQILPFGRYLLNSGVVAGLAVPLTLLTASWAGFAMSQLEARWRRWLVILSVGALLIPVTALWLARMVLFRWLGLINTWGALLAPACMGSSPLFVLLFYWAFRRLPREQFELARLDGAGALAVWRRVAWPQVRSASVAVGALTFFLYWGDFISPLLYLKSQSLYTLPVGLQQLQQLDVTQGPLLMVGAVIATLPPVLVFLLAQRFVWPER